MIIIPEHACDREKEDGGPGQMEGQGDGGPGGGVVRGFSK